LFLKGAVGSPGPKGDRGEQVSDFSACINTIHGVIENIFLGTYADLIEFP